jgi:hypothetical protein
MTISCALCRFGDEDNEEHAIILTCKNYITNNITSTRLDEIAAQVSSALNESPNNIFHMNPKDVTIHITKHMLHQRVVMTNILRDLIYFAEISKNNCTVTCPQTGKKTIDPRTYGMLR